MIRYLFILFLVIILGYFFLQSKSNAINDETPIFLREDLLAFNHKTDINISVHSFYHPDSSQLDILEHDYNNIWAHLNYLYATNDIVKGKEYYTEKWFKQISNHHDSRIEDLQRERRDIKHELHIQNWASDDLVCTAVDSNVVLQYKNANHEVWTTHANLSLVLLFQGDHWRLDAVRVLDETVQ